MPALEHVRMNARTWRAGRLGLEGVLKKWKTLCVAAGQFNASPLGSITFDYIYSTVENFNLHMLTAYIT